MASFRSHVSLGIASGILGIVAFIFITTLDTPHLLLAVFVAGACLVVFFAVAMVLGLVGCG